MFAVSAEAVDADGRVDVGPAWAEVVDGAYTLPVPEGPVDLWMVAGRCARCGQRGPTACPMGATRLATRWMGHARADTVTAHPLALTVDVAGAPLPDAPTSDRPRGQLVIEAVAPAPRGLPSGRIERSLGHSGPVAIQQWVLPGDYMARIDGSLGAQSPVLPEAAVDLGLLRVPGAPEHVDVPLVPVLVSIPEGWAGALSLRDAGGVDYRLRRHGDGWRGVVPPGPYVVVADGALARGSDGEPAWTVACEVGL